MYGYLNLVWKFIFDLLKYKFYLDFYIFCPF